MLAELEDLATDLVDHHRLVDGATTFEDMLDHIVAVLILHQLPCAAMEFFEEGAGLDIRTVFKHPLDHTAAIGVGGEVVHLTMEGIDDELNMDGRDTLNCLS